MPSITTNLCLLALRPIRTKMDRSLPSASASAGRETEVAFANRVSAALTALSANASEGSTEERKAYRSAANHVDTAIDLAKTMVANCQAKKEIEARQQWDGYVAVLRDVHRRLDAQR